MAGDTGQHVERLAHHHLDPEQLEEAEHLRTVRAEEAVGVDEGQVAGEHADALPEATGVPPEPRGQVGVPELHVQRGLAPTAPVVVHHIVLDDGEGVEQLEAAAGIEHLTFVQTTASAIGPVAEHGSNVFSPIDHQVAEFANHLFEEDMGRSPYRRLGGEVSVEPLDDELRWIGP